MESFELASGRNSAADKYSGVVTTQFLYGAHQASLGLPLSDLSICNAQVVQPTGEQCRIRVQEIGDRPDAMVGHGCGNTPHNERHFRDSIRQFQKVAAHAE